MMIAITAIETRNWLENAGPAVGEARCEREPLSVLQGHRDLQDRESRRGHASSDRASWPRPTIEPGPIIGPGPWDAYSQMAGPSEARQGDMRLLAEPVGSWSARKSLMA